MPSTTTRTRYAADTDGMVCLLLDVRGKVSPYSLLIWSYGKNKLVKLSYRYRNGRELIRDETPEAQRWAAVSVPRWLANREGLYGKPNLSPVMAGFCRDLCTDMRTPRMIHDDGERELAEFIVSEKNRYRKLPGQRLQDGKTDRRNGGIFA